jgi:hypothetical protein
LRAVPRGKIRRRLHLTDATRAGDGLHPCSDVDAIAKEVAALDHYISNVNADPEVDWHASSFEILARFMIS